MPVSDLKIVNNIDVNLIFNHQENFQQECLKILFRALVDYLSTVMIMKSWISSLLHPWQPTTPTATRETFPQVTYNGKMTLIKQSKPLQINAKIDTFPGSNLYDAHAASDPHTKCDRPPPCIFSFSCLDRGRLPTAIPTVSDMKKLTSSYQEQVNTPHTKTNCQQDMWCFGIRIGSGVATSSTDDWDKMVKLSHSAPSVLCTTVAVSMSENIGKATKAGTSCVGEKTTACEVVNNKILDSQLTSVKDSQNQDDAEKCLMSDDHIHARTMSSTPSFHSCKNPIISYILGCDNDSVSDATFEDDDKWSDSQTDDAQSEAFTVPESEDCPESLWEEFGLRSCFMSRLSCSAQRICGFAGDQPTVSDIVSAETDVLCKQVPRMSSSSSDYWSDDEDVCDEEDVFLDEFKSVPECQVLQQPRCLNPCINYILNCDDSDSENIDAKAQNHQSSNVDTTNAAGKMCHADEPNSETLWDYFMKTNDEYSLNCGSKIMCVSKRDISKNVLLKKNSEKKRTCKVRFDDKPACIHHMRTWAFAYRESRRGHWESYARDRERFRLRSLEVETAISWCFKPAHRQMVWEKHYSKLE